MGQRGDCEVTPLSGRARNRGAPAVWPHSQETLGHMGEASTAERGSTVAQAGGDGGEGD